jgi:CRISPR/Cas system CMR subunit Cmr4 (Cas7 group RAMP superfamily)
VEGGALFNQENVPCEALFYSVLTVLPPRRNGLAADFDANAKLGDLLPTPNPPILQIGGDETTGHGLCETKREEL